MAKATHRARIIQDDSPSSPREWDNIGKMYCWHTRYNLGDEQIDRPYDQEQYDEFLAEHGEGAVILPLYLYDHSGITMSCTPFSCAWDSGQVGYIVAEEAAIRASFNIKDGDPITEELRKMAERALEGEVAVYDHYLTGNVWGYSIEKIVTCGECGHVRYEDEDSCWGFFGDFEESGLKEQMQSYVGDEITSDQVEAAWDNRFDT